jgi:hypothetical protein|tara:strand:- start:186 stop:413 length:228 start_codon:yes stop_codon:yes gene_type:complete
MFTIKYCPSYYPQAISLSAKINSIVLDTCEIEEGKKDQFEVFRSGELFLSKEDMGRFPTVTDVNDMTDQLDPYSG